MSSTLLFAFRSQLKHFLRREVLPDHLSELATSPAVSFGHCTPFYWTIRNNYMCVWCSMKTDCLAHCWCVQHLVQSLTLSWFSGWFFVSGRLFGKGAVFPVYFANFLSVSGLLQLEVRGLSGNGFPSNITADRWSLISCPNGPITSQDSPFHPWAALVDKFFLTLDKTCFSIIYIHCPPPSFGYNWSWPSHTDSPLNIWNQLLCVS